MPGSDYAARIVREWTFCLIISCVDKIVIISISDINVLIYLSFNKYSSMIECHVLWGNNLICDLITSLGCLTALDWVLDQSEYLIFLCIGLNNEHSSSFVDVTEGEVNVETDGFLRWNATISEKSMMFIIVFHIGILVKCGYS